LQLRWSEARKTDGVWKLGTGALQIYTPSRGKARFRPNAASKVTVRYPRFTSATPLSRVREPFDQLLRHRFFASQHTTDIRPGDAKQSGELISTPDLLLKSPQISKSLSENIMWDCIVFAA
jgi:hypothetical protein